MGKLQAEELVTELNQEQALRIHLQCNHYPPVHESFIPVAQRAIELVNKGKYTTTIDMPNGKTLTAANVVEGLHLDCFLEEEVQGDGSGDN